MRTYLFTIMAITALLVANVAGGTGLDTDSAELPPEDGSYVAPDEYLEFSDADITFDNPVIGKFIDIYREAMPDDDEREHFLAFFTAVEIETGLGSIALTGPVEMVHYDRLLGTTGTFDAEIVSMSLSGGGIMIRQDPNRASLGETDIIDIGGGLYHIDSFFDVFTELSTDNGSTWTPSDTSTNIYLVPEPATIILFGLGGLTLLRRRRA